MLSSIVDVIMEFMRNFIIHLAQAVWGSSCLASFRYNVECSRFPVLSATKVGTAAPAFLLAHLIFGLGFSEIFLRDLGGRASPFTKDYKQRNQILFFLFVIVHQDES